MIDLIIFIILVAMVILATSGFFTKAKTSALETDLHPVKTAGKLYRIDSSDKRPTAS